ncbi:MAG: 50S ribosomal protein L25/general stress protein Ctc [Micavibrio sp.]|nr:50S ribosomal protein L25/general stress protein Ctc [Micavibrio sp.]
MSKNIALTAAKRDGAGKGIARALRRENRVPAVIYGDSKAPVTISLSARDINVEYQKGQMFTKLCDLDLDGSKNLVLARDIQLHPVTDVVLHVDFLRVTPKTKIAVNVPVNFINAESCPGLESRGTLNVTRHTVELVCSATKIPDVLDVDLAGKDLGDAIKISDASLPEGVKPVIDDRDFTIATMVAPRTVAEEAAADAEGNVESEPVIEGEEPAAEGEAAAKE